MEYDGNWGFILDCEQKIQVKGVRGQPLIKRVVGDGKSTFLWLDNWHPLEPWYKKIAEQVVFDLGRLLRATVAEIIHEGAWKWPRRRNGVAQAIMANTPNSLVPHTDRHGRVI